MKYNCERCQKEFSQKSHYKSHKQRKKPCVIVEPGNPVDKPIDEPGNPVDKPIDEPDDEHVEELSKGIEKLSIKTCNKSPLRYPGGKTRACSKIDDILNENFDINDFDNIVSPFFGGGSFEFHIQNKYDLNIIANDKFKPLYNFWMTCKSDNGKLCKRLTEQIDLVDKQQFKDLRKQIMTVDNEFLQAYMYFIINRCSFSGATLSGGFSQESSKKRFTLSSINKIRQLKLDKFNLYNLDFEEFINNLDDDKRNLIFLDPPYYLEKASKLYGNNGDLHDTFNHNKLYECISKKENWIMSYNNCDYIKNLYKDYKIVPTNWSYGMNKSKKSSEIIIIGLTV